jgi:diaminohydroxyphosphoribosylaminopyrimidine deaminase/5-amino-6-(5-phosphoribosylamino)uracil reductase
VRIVLDPDARLPTDRALFADVAEAPVWMFVREDAAEADLERLEATGASVHPVPALGAHSLDLRQVLAVCREAGLSAILCEGGGRVGSSLVRAGLVSRLHLFVVPRVLGPKGVPAFPDWPASSGPGGPSWVPAEPARTLGVDTLITLDRTVDGEDR